MNKILLNKRKSLVLFFASLIIVALLSSGLFNGPVYAYASTNADFVARKANVDFTQDNYSVTNAPAITVLTHGLGGQASHWSNNGTFAFAYDNRSLIEQLRQESGGQVYLAKMNENLSFKLRKVPIQAQLTSYTINTLVTLPNLTFNEIYQHMIIVFEAYSPYAINVDVYNEFKTMLLDIAHDFGYLTGGVYPKINLIGHSRGGLTNMDFANEHPRLIDSMFALGSPFLGSNFGRVNLFADMVMGLPCPALANINESTEQNRLKNSWNNNQQNGRGSHIKFYPMSGTSTLGMIASSVGGTWGTIAASLIELPPLTFPVLVTTVSTIIWAAEQASNLPKTSWATINDAFYEAFSGWAWLHISSNTTIEDDLLVNKKSAEAKGYQDITEVFNKKFNNYIFKNFDSDRLAEPNYAIAHNLETRDDGFIDWIMDRLDTSFKLFDTTSLVGNKVRIDKVNFTINGAFNIPNTLSGMTVTEIGFGAFMDQDLMTNVTIPNSVTYIGILAFAGCTRLKTVVIPDKITRIENYTFQRCTSLTSVIFEGVVTEIGNSAFSLCTNLSSINLPHGLKTIEDYAFMSCSKLTSITIPSTVTSIKFNAFFGYNLNINWTHNSDTLDPQLYGYPNGYNFLGISKEITTSNEGSVVTQRLRAGYIYGNGSSGQRYLTLSAKTANAGLAYIEYYFLRNVTKIDYQLALWSSSESLILNSRIALEVLDCCNIWREVRVFSANSMSTDKDDLWDYQTTLPVSTKAFRFVIETNQVQNNNNRGRMVIGNIDISYT